MRISLRYILFVAVVISVVASVGFVVAAHHGSNRGNYAQVRSDMLTVAKRIGLRSMESTSPPQSGDEGCVVVYQGYVAKAHSLSGSQRLIRSLRETGWIPEKQYSIDGAVVSLLSKEGWDLRLREYGGVKSMSAASVFFAMIATKNSCSLAGPVAPTEFPAASKLDV
ncbi:hypothetical protein ACFWBV_31485 [Streptomyces sp. NPDC060030]|uniref:hypothetical protein n=1 Tax=Streptomyces sp. NPDC060030 TaxID=3347042 RepID=UPI00369F6A86